MSDSIMLITCSTLYRVVLNETNVAQPRSHRLRRTCSTLYRVVLNETVPVALEDFYNLDLQYPLSGRTK